MKINLNGLLDEIGDMDAIPYMLKLYLRDILELPIDIDPKNPGDTEITSSFADINYKYNVDENGFSIDLEYLPTRL